MLLAEDLQDPGRAEPPKAVHGTGRHDPHLARATHARLAVDLDEHLSFQYAQELLGPVVAVEIRDLVRRDGLNQQDEPIQPVLRPREVSDFPSLRRERHRSDPSSLGSTAWPSGLLV